MSPILETVSEFATEPGLAHIAGAAMDLDRPVGDPAHHLGAEHLRARGLERHALARVVAPRDVAQHALGRIEIGLAVGEHRLDELIMADRFAELLAIGGIARRLVEDAPRLADGEDRKSTRLNSSH